MSVDVIGIIKNLGADNTLLYQFIIVVGLYALSKFLFFNKLEEVVMTREEKTVKLDGSADKQFEEIEKLQKDYKDQISKANKSAKENFDNSKMEISKKLETHYRDEETKVNSFVDESRKQAIEEVESKKGKVLAEAKELSESLVQKIIKG